ncbi:rab11 family-interacting protein 5 isoform X2 [Hyla sarda]|uniref:rab11 family-interacting protein 5 isoform X2 n=1 Tax=Hyla sarda TaxID=327740 RepID=UPI0024C41761|nr:rab11 family-interacting protein 5 isoform X2 [Hyla sarda]
MTWIQPVFRWYKLHSKPGKKEKDRGEIQVSIQFTRNNLTASMFDLSIKDKPKTPFGKLKDKLKVKKHSQFESSSAIVPSSIGRLDSDDEDGKKSKSKAAAFFKGRLRKSSLTRSNTSLGSDSTISSTSGTIPTSAGISVVLPDVVKKPATRNSSLSTEPTVKDSEASPRNTHKRAFSDEVSKLKLFPEPKSVQNLKPKGSPISKSSVCINGSHVYTEVSAPKPNPALEKSAPASMSLQNIVKKAEDVADVIRGPSHSSAKSEHKPAGPAVEEQSASYKPTPRNETVQAETKPVQITSPMVFTEDVSKSRSQEAKAKEEKSKVGLQHGTGKTDQANKSLAEPKPHVPSSSEERGKVSSWFGSKDAKENQQKPSFPSGSIATSEAAERGSSLVEEHSPSAFYHRESGNVEVVGDRPEFRLTQSSSSKPPVVLGWEEQFDALASSRLQPSNGNSQQTEDHDVASPSEKYPLSSPFAKRETGTLYEGDEWPNLQSHDSNLNTCLPEILNNDVEKSSELSPLPINLLPNFSPPYIPSPGSTGLKSFDKLSTNTLKDVNMFSLPVLGSTENRVATVQPRVLMEQNMASIGQVARKDSPVVTKDSIAIASIGERALEVVESGIDIHNTQVSKESVKQVSTEHNPERIRVEQVMPNEKVESIIKEEAISVDVGSAAPPKPPRLMQETEDDNCEQTSHQDTTGKQIENPEEHKQEQNMGVSKQSVSPVACCPVIEIRSPVLDAFTEDTQSTTEGLLTNLREENNDFSKLGAVNGEHLLDVNDMTATEQFRTCPSNVSLDTDLSSPHEGSDKLELMSHGPSKPLSTTLGGSKHEDFIFQKPMPLSKIQKGSRSELSSQSKKCDQTDFWSALEEQTPSSLIGLDAKQNVSTNLCDSAPSDDRIVSPLNSEQKPEPEQNKSEDALVLQGAELASPPPNVLQEHKLESDTKALRHDGQHGYSLSQQSSWSADIIVDFKNEDFWRIDSDQLDQNHVQNLPSPGNPFSPVDRTPFLSHKNPFIVEHTPSSQSSESSLQEDISFKDLHARAALKKFPSAVPPNDVKAYLHVSQPLAFSTPSLATAPNLKPSNFPSPIMLLTTPGATTTTNTHTASLSGLHSPVAGGVTTAAPPILPLETQTADNPFMTLKTSPHPVKPISATLSESTPEKKTQRPAITTALSSGLEMLKSVTGGQNPNAKKQDERLKDLSLPDQAAKYYHLTHDELIQMLLQREDELSREQNHVKELEEYIDKLLVRIMDQAPALLQAPLETNQ